MATSTYVEQTVDTIAAFLQTHTPKTFQLFGGDSITCLEIGDGNLNLVFLVQSNTKTLIVKQSLPYVRCVGASLPLTLERSRFEFMALQAHGAADPDHVPRVHYFNETHGLIVMDYIPPPNCILRKVLLKGIVYDNMPRHVAQYCARTLFLSSGFALGSTELRQRVEVWTRNVELCALTEQVIFTEPYVVSANNRWTSPQLDDDKKALETNDALRMQVERLKHKFITETQALVHGDLHTGSVMCSENETYVIDPEFAFYGNMGLDTGLFIANLLLHYVSEEGADATLEQVRVFWMEFVKEFTHLWSTEHTGYMYQSLSKTATEHAQQVFFQSLLEDTLGFCGVEMIRRVVGIAHVEDLERIEDADVRAKCERRGLNIGKALVLTANKISTIENVLELARSTE
jgi:5-methylthioribose kinase